MGIEDIPTGPKGKVPRVCYVFVEIPMGSRNKYETDKRSGRIFLDRVLFSTERYPGDYGFIPQTLSEDGDPLDCLVLVSESNFHGAIIPVRPVAVINMSDEKGKDDKIVAVPDFKVDPRFERIKDLKDLPKHQLFEIRHFFEHMKELEPGKWVKVKGWSDAAAARAMIKKAIAAYKKSKS